MSPKPGLIISAVGLFLFSDIIYSETKALKNNYVFYTPINFYFLSDNHDGRLTLTARTLVHQALIWFVND